MELQVGRLISWPVKKLEDFIVGLIFYIDITRQFEGLDTRSNRNYNIKFMGK